MADGLLRGAARFDQGKQHRLRCAGAASDELPRGRTGAGGEGGREEGGGDNINSAGDKMMRGIFPLAEMRAAAGEDGDAGMRVTRKGREIFGEVIAIEGVY